jgi:methionyl-tRNA synthetase
MPGTARGIAEQLGIHVNFDSARLKGVVTWGELKSGTKIRKGPALFPRILLAESGVQGGKSETAERATSQGAKPVSNTPTASQSTGGAAAMPTPAGSQGAAPVAPTHITIEEFQKVQLKTAKVLSAERVPKSEKLLKLQVSIGDEQRQIVAGIGKRYEPESLIGKTIVIVANLKPAKLMGIESQGMVLAAGDTEVRGLATILEEVDPGTKVK